VDKFAWGVVHGAGIGPEEVKGPGHVVNIRPILLER
jgi:hypothetical protein